MRLFDELTGLSDICIDQDDDIATEIRSILDRCPGELRSRHLELRAQDVAESRHTRLPQKSSSQEIIPAYRVRTAAR